MNLSKYITDDRWDAVFDELDADRNGVLCYSEFWSKMAIRNSSDLVNALKQFDVSSSLTPKIRTKIEKWIILNQSVRYLDPSSQAVDYTLNFYLGSRQKQRSCNQSCWIHRTYDINKMYCEKRLGEIVRWTGYWQKWRSFAFRILC